MGLHTKVEERVDLIVETTENSSWRDEMVSLIEDVDKRLDKALNMKYPYHHWGLCSIISFNDDKRDVHYDLGDIVMRNPTDWSFETDRSLNTIILKGDDLGEFVWEPGKIEPRREFLRELIAYIKR